MVKYFIDSEFIEDGETIDLISIGIVSDDNRKYYAINRNCNFRKASDWVLENVLLPIGMNRQGVRYPQPTMEGFHDLDRIYVDKSDPFIIPKSQIKQNILNFCLWRKTGFVPYDSYSRININNEDLTPEFYGYYSDYDWVSFCQLFGTMLDLPTGFPMYCKDLKQDLDRLNNLNLKTLGKPLDLKLPPNDAHHALEDAIWIKGLYDKLLTLDNSI